MAKIEMGKGFDAYLLELEKWEKKDSVPVMKMALYDGASVVLDGLHQEISSWSGSDPMNGPTSIDKEDLLKGLGISPMDYNGDDVDVKIGFAGYGHKTAKYNQKGVPIPMIARSIIAGTSFRNKYDFVGKVVRKTRNQSIEKMDETLNREIEKRLNNG